MADTRANTRVSVDLCRAGGRAAAAGGSLRVYWSGVGVHSPLLLRWCCDQLLKRKLYLEG